MLVPLDFSTQSQIAWSVRHVVRVFFLTLRSPIRWKIVCRVLQTLSREVVRALAELVQKIRKLLQKAKFLRAVSVMLAILVPMVDSAPCALLENTSSRQAMRPVFRAYRANIPLRLAL